MNQQIVVAAIAKLAGISTFLKCIKTGGTQIVGGQFVIISKAGLEQAFATIDECLDLLNGQLFSGEPE